MKNQIKMETNNIITQEDILTYARVLNKVNNYDMILEVLKEITLNFYYPEDGNYKEYETILKKAKEAIAKAEITII